MALPGGMSMLYLVGLLVLGLGLLLHIVGLATPEWSVHQADDSAYIGLFRRCLYGFSGFSGRACEEHSIKSSKVEACEAFAILGMLAGFVGLGLAIVHVVLPIMGKNQIRLLPMIAALACFAGFGCILLTVIIWGAAVHDSDNYDIGYSFALSLVGGILMAVAGALLFVGGKQAAS